MTPFSRRKLRTASKKAAELWEQILCVTGIEIDLEKVLKAEEAFDGAIAGIHAMGVHIGFLGKMDPKDPATDSAEEFREIYSSDTARIPTTMVTIDTKMRFIPPQNDEPETLEKKTVIFYEIDTNAKDSSFSADPDELAQ